MEMMHRDRFRKVMNFEPVSRLPQWEWVSWWDKTIERWRKEGLPDDFRTDWDIRERFFGLDPFRSFWFGPRKPDFPEKIEWGDNDSTNLKIYENLKEHLYPENIFENIFVEKGIDPIFLKSVAEKQKNGEMVVWLILEGAFWFPRTLFGIEKHLTGFYDSPETMTKMISDLLIFNLRVLEEFCKISTPDILDFAEDMSYNHGPMIGKNLFDKFLAPYYKKILPSIKKRGIVPFIDTDGQIEQLVPWFLDLGIEGFLPLERQAGVDIVKLRKKYPKIKFIGGYNKMVMSRTEEEMREEFERLLPIMKQGGFIPAVDHQTPPEVSLKNYKIYLNLLREYSTKCFT